MRSRAIGAPSAVHTRTRVTAAEPAGTSGRCASQVGSATTDCSMVRASGFRPRARMSRENQEPTARERRDVAANVPTPGRMTMTPSPSSARSAPRTVIRATP